MRPISTLRWMLTLVTVGVALLMVPVPAQIRPAPGASPNVSTATGTLTAPHGGTGQTSFTIGDLLYASSSSALSKLAAVATGSYLRAAGTGTAPVWSTTTLPNSATQGDLMVATGANAYGSVAAVATGQVLTSAGTGTVPTYSANPSVTTVTVKGGSGTGTMKTEGVLCDSVAGTCGCTTFTDASVQNQWNVITCTIPASTLAVNGDELRFLVEYEAAGNTNTKEMQMFWNGGTCSGNSAAMCSTGTSIWGAGVTNASSGVSMSAITRVKRTASGAQTIIGTIRASTAVIGQDAKAVSVTDTNTIAVSFGIRNTSAAAASTQAPVPTMTILYLPQ